MQDHNKPGDTAMSGNRRNKNRHKKAAKKLFQNKERVRAGGTSITDDQYTYFKHIIDENEKFECLEDKANMTNNVFEETIGQEVYLSSNQLVCKVLEDLIGFTSVEHFERFQKSFLAEIRPICSHKFASHVLEKIIEISFLRAVGSKNPNSSEPARKKTKLQLLSEKEYNITNDFPDQHRQNCADFVFKTGKFLLNNLEDFIWDLYANHIIRTSILCLGGISTGKVAFIRTNEKSMHGESYPVPEEWSQIIVEYVNRLQLWPQFKDLPYSELSSALLGCICIVLKRIDKNLLKHFGKKILLDSFLKVNDSDDKKEIEINDKEDTTTTLNENHLPKVFQSASSLRLCETLLTVAGRKLFTQLYAMLLTGHLTKLALNRQTSYVVQKLIENIKDKEDFEAVFTEISESIEELLRCGHTGTITALSGGCLRLATKQAAFLTSMQKALHTGNAKEQPQFLFKCFLKLKPYKVALDDKTEFIHVDGSMIIQNILQFNKPISLVNSILAVPSNELAAIFSSIKGSFIADAFLDSKFIGEKSREKLIRYLEGSYVDMAITKFGSRVVEKLFEAATEGQKCRIAKELAGKCNLLNGNPFGRIVFFKFRLNTYQLSPNEWIAASNKANKAETLFKDILSK